MTSTLPIVTESYPFIDPGKYAGKLNGKVTIITGASSGIGISVCKAFAAAGAHVACVARRENELKAVVDEITTSGGKAIPIVADILKRGAAKEIVTRVESELGPVDILVNNAGAARIGVLVVEDEDLDIWFRIYELNVRAPVRLIRAVLPGMIERKSGKLITVSSSVATLQLPAMSAYASSKAAITKFHESLTPELADTGVTSFAVHPGVVDSGLGKAQDAINRDSLEHPAVKNFIASVSGEKTKQKPEVPANTMVALAADERYAILNGHHINADQELEPVLLEAEKEGKGRIGKERLYYVNIGAL